MSVWVHRCACGARAHAPVDAMRSTGVVRAAAEVGRSTGGAVAVGGAVAPDGSATRRFAVDVHCHVLTPAVEQLVATHPRRLAEPALMRAAMGEDAVAHNLAVMLPYAAPRLTRIEARLADMDTMGVDVQVVSPSPNQYCYWAEPTLAAEIVQLQNEHIAALCRAHPARLRGLGTVALQHPAMAAEQLTHALEVLGLKGVEISTSVEGLELDDRSLDPFWDAAARLGAVVFIHPFGTTLGARTATHYLSNVIGQPLETTLALSRLIFGGTLDRFPNLRILAAHGGGYLPTYAGRTGHAHAVRPEAKSMRRAPREYLCEMYFDSVVYEPLALRQLIDNVGVSQVLMGTDYPFDMGHDAPHALVDALPEGTETERVAVLGGNARRLFGI